jgi:hypothetical protein
MHLDNILPFYIRPAPNNLADATLATAGTLAKALTPDPSCWSIKAAAG